MVAIIVLSLLVPVEVSHVAALRSHKVLIMTMDKVFNYPPSEDNDKRNNPDSYIINGETYFALKQDNWVPDREQFVVDKWGETFPSKANFTYDKIISLVSRSDSLGSWYTAVISDYRDAVALPVHLQDILGDLDYKKVCADLVAHNVARRELSEANEKAAAEYKAKLRMNEDRFKRAEEQRMKDPLLFILTLKSTSLPLGVLDRIDEYVPKDENDPITARIYAREQLLRYQRRLVEEMKKGADVFEIVRKEQIEFVNPI